jgi:hypothetical protein
LNAQQNSAARLADTIFVAIFVPLHQGRWNAAAKTGSVAMGILRPPATIGVLSHSTFAFSPAPLSVSVRARARYWNLLPRWSRLSSGTVRLAAFGFCHRTRDVATRLCSLIPLV